MARFPSSLEHVIEELMKLPTIGRKSAERLAFHLLRRGAACCALADALREMHERITFCPECFHVAEGGLCAICADPSREKSVICVVESPMDIMAIEKSGTYRGLYHVLQGRLSPLAGITPDNLRIRELLERVGAQHVEEPAHGAAPKIAEVILATSPDVEGDATALYLSGILRPLEVTVSRIGLGVPVGSSLEYADEMTLAKALEGRKAIS